MNKGRTKNNVKFFFFLLILCVVVFGAVYLLNSEDNALQDLIDNMNGESSIIDNYNGVYVYSMSVNGSKNMFRGCIIDHIDYYIMIVNDKYYTYRSSCIGTFPFEEGNTKDLEIYENKEANTFYIKNDGLVYAKNPAIRSVNVVNNLANYGEKFQVNNYQLLFEESQFPGAYFSVKRLEIDNLSSDMFIEFGHIFDERFKMTISGQFEGEVRELYSYIFDDFKHMPQLYPYGAYLVIIEKNESEDKYHHTIKVYNNEGIVYNLEQQFPIVVDDVSLDMNNSIFVKFDEYNRTFKLLIGNDKNMCVEESEDKTVTYYEFEVDYNYTLKGFERPVFVKQGYAKDGCKYVDEVMGR